jgi:hypothetical protein
MTAHPDVDGALPFAVQARESSFIDNNLRCISCWQLGNCVIISFEVL